MKKNILTIVIMAASLLNLVLTIVIAVGVPNKYLFFHSI